MNEDRYRHMTTSPFFIGEVVMCDFKESSYLKYNQMYEIHSAFYKNSEWFVKVKLDNRAAPAAFYAYKFRSLTDEERHALED